MAESATRSGAPERAAQPAPAAAAAELLAAIGFLTRLPLRPGWVHGDRTGGAAYGLVGAGLGLAAGVPVLIAGAAHPVLASLAALALLAVLDGGLHLDGLADTVDALAAPPGSANRARTDPRAGTAGVVAVVLALGLDAAALADLAGRGGFAALAAVVAAAAASRAIAPAWAVLVGRRRTPAEGLGSWFAETTTGFAATIALVTAAIFVGVAVELGGVSIGIGALVGTIAAAFVGGAVIRWRRQLDGDGYGAVIEMTFTAIVVASAAAAVG
ncbi:MAG: hypothetical protein E6I26_13700 [Chloroflexi bacterium]|nr:MAG: hypothetical protein E6I26_13700 [Chloroflexota bacterium]